MQKAVTPTLVAVTEIRPTINVTSDPREQDAKSLKDPPHNKQSCYMWTQKHTQNSLKMNWHHKNNFISQEQKMILINPVKVLFLLYVS